MKKEIGLDVCRNGLPVATFFFSSEKQKKSFEDYMILKYHTQQPIRRVTFEEILEKRLYEQAERTNKRG